MATKQSKMHGRVEGASGRCAVPGCKHVGEFKAPVEPGDFEGHDGVMSTLGSPASWVLRNAEGREVTVVPRARLHADESVVILEAAAAGFGIATLPVGIVRDFVADGRLVQVMSGWSAGSVTTTLLMPSRRGQLPSVRAVVDAMVKGLAAENDWSL